MKKINEANEIQALANQIKQLPADQQEKIKSVMDNQLATSSTATTPNNTTPNNNTPTAGAPSSTQFAQDLKKMADQFISADGALGAPAVKRVLKDLWMQAGGLRAESYKTRLSRLQTVINESNLIREEIKELKRKKSSKRPKTRG